MHILQAVSGFTSVHLAYLYKVKKKKQKNKKKHTLVNIHKIKNLNIFHKKCI